MKPPNVSAYAVTTHCRLVCEKCRSRPIVGSETLTIVRSIIVMKNATANSANALQRLIFGDVDVIGPPAVWSGWTEGWVLVWCCIAASSWVVVTKTNGRPRSGHAEVAAPVAPQKCEPVFVLVHSPLVGPTTRSPVGHELERRGREVVVPSLLGVAEAPAPQWRHVPDAVQAATAQTHAAAAFWVDPRWLARPA
jgi:hypothetical protein